MKVQVFGADIRQAKMPATFCEGYNIENINSLHFIALQETHASFSIEIAGKCYFKYFGQLKLPEFPSLIFYKYFTVCMLFWRKHAN